MTATVTESSMRWAKEIHILFKSKTSRMKKIQPHSFLWALYHLTAEE